MTKWTHETAEVALRALIEEIPALASGTRSSAAHARWLANTLRILEQVFGGNSRYYLSFADLTWAEAGSFLFGGPADPEGSWNPQAAIERRHHQAYVRQLDFARGLLQAALDELRHSGLSGVYEGKNTGPESSDLLKILTLVERKLRKVLRTQPAREREVQDAFENLLVGADLEYSRETDSIEYSSKTYTPDFTFSRVDLAVDLKLCNREGREKEIIAEINDDILAYRTKYGNLLFIVYDLGFIRDVERLSETFESHEGVLIRIVKH